MSSNPAGNTSYGLYTAISIVIANMIGTGIFTSLGFQVMALHSGFSIMMLWLLGGVSALMGAMAYAELGAVMPRSGGEYHFLSRIYHPSLGFMSGWVSFAVGFAAPTAAAATALSAYFTAALGIRDAIAGIDSAIIISILVIVFLSWLHARHKEAGAGFQNIFTSIKLLVLILFILVGLIFRGEADPDFAAGKAALREIFSPAFASAIFYVSFAFSGWNAAAYITSEIRHAQKNIPRSLILGTAAVTLLYLGMTYVFLETIPMQVMAGKIEIGYLYGQQFLGEHASTVMGLLFSLLLLSTVSSMIITGPRVTQVMGEDYRAIAWFSRMSTRNTPARAIYIQGLLAIFYVLTATFDQMITYIGFTLNAMTLLTVVGLILHREKHGKYMEMPYKIRPYPLLPLLFILINLWIAVYGLLYRPVESVGGLVTAVLGLLIWLLLQRSGPRARPG